jgi:hypothetical protein
MHTTSRRVRAALLLCSMALLPAVPARAEGSLDWPRCCKL